MKKFLMIIVSSLLSLSLSGLPVYANTTDNEKNGDVPEIYVDENYGNQTSESITPRTRGNCTDVYSRAWCNAHGFQNNRPVPGKVTLNSKEKGCYLDAVLRGVGASLTGLINGVGYGVFVGPAYAVYEFWRCLM